MRSLFAKVFLSFWLTVALVGVTLYLTNLPRRRYEASLRAVTTELAGEKWHTRMALALPNAAAEAATAYETGGRPRLEAALRQTLESTHAQPFFFDGSGNPLLNYGDLPGRVRESARDLKARPDTEVLDTRAPSGKRYALVLWDPSQTQTSMVFLSSPAVAAGGRVPGRWWTPAEPDSSAPKLLDQSPWLFLLAVLIFGGGVCFWLTRHITRPLLALGTTAGALADGQLDARAGAPLTGRGDEVGELARD